MKNELITRKQYLDREAAHDAYYGQFVDADPCIMRTLEAQLGNKIRASIDEHFNDVQLHLWDRLPKPIVAHRLLSKANGGREGFLTSSLSDWTCIYKAAAKRIREQAQRSETGHDLAPGSHCWHLPTGQERIGLCVSIQGEVASVVWENSGTGPVAIPVAQLRQAPAHWSAKHGRIN